MDLSATVQLMELAGLACAQTLATVYDAKKYRRVLVCCGPGNQAKAIQFEVRMVFLIVLLP